jgi:hypothetical protein
VILEPGKSIYFSTYPPPTLIHFLYHFPSASKPAAQKILTVVSATFAPGRASLSNFLETISRPSCEPLYATNISHRKQGIFLYGYPLHLVLLPIKNHNRTLLFGSMPLKHGRNFDYRNQRLNMRMRVCFLDCHEAGLCCYLVIHIETLLRPLQLFYFHL